MAPTNQYHLLAAIPAVEAWEMPPALEALAQELVQSGLLRINADHARNFVRHGTADSDRTFTARELTDPRLAPRTHRLLQRLVPPAAGAEGVAQLRERLFGELKRARGIDAAREMKVARVLVQAAHPSVIRLVLQAGTAVFVSYSHTVGDLLAVHEWQHHGDAGGLQATSAESTAVYVSCGGDPFFAGEQKTYVTDGFPALARMMVIGGQELGHYADLLRQDGQITGRYSTDNRTRALRADPAVKAARRADRQRVAQLGERAAQAGLGALLYAEQAVAFYDRPGMQRSLPWLLRELRRLWRRWRFRRRAAALGAARDFGFVLPAMRHGTAYATYLSDMAFNLAPMADAYRHPDPEAEEAIACIEALARVPQQVHKWGHAHVRADWPQLYALYFGTVIPGCIRAAGGANPSIRPVSGWRVVWRRWRRKRPGYYPEKHPLRGPVAPD